MANKEKNSNPEVERLLRDLYREDVERVSRGESAVYFGHLNDKPLIDEHPEFDWMTRVVPIPIKRPNTRLSLIDDAVDLYERTNRSGATLPEINKRVGEFIRGLGDRMPGTIGSAWRGLFDFSQHSPDKGIAGSAFLPMSVIQRDENARREANGEYPLGYVSAIDFIWPREKYGTPWDKRTPEEVRQWEIEHGTRNAAEVELPNVDVYPRDIKDDGGDVVASFSLPNVDIYPQDRFGDIARSQGIETARAWRDVRNAVSEGRNEFMNDPRTQIVASLLPIPAGVEGTDVVIPYLQRFGNRFRSLIAGLSLRGNPSYDKITELLAKRAVQREFKSAPDMVFVPNKRPTIVIVKEVDGKFQRVIEEVDLPDYIDEKNLVDVTDGVYAYKNPKSRKGIIKNGKGIDNVSIVHADPDIEGNVWLHADGKKYNIGHYETMEPDSRYIHMDSNPTGNNDASMAHFDDNGIFVPGKSDHGSDYIWWEKNAPFYELGNRIIDIDADDVSSRSAKFVTGFGSDNSVLTKGMDLKSLDPKILERNPYTGYFNRVRLRKKGGAVYNWSDKDEIDFQDWYARVSEYKGLNPDPDDGNQYYDYRTFWKENPDGMADKMLTDDAGAHFTDRYKLPGHPTFSNESMYSNDETPGGSWERKDGKWYFKPSDYTRTYLDRTLYYLAGDKDNGIYIDGEYRMVPKKEDGGNVSSYTVKSGDTLSGIAESLGISVDSLMSANPDISSPDKINVGQKINVSGVYKLPWILGADKNFYNPDNWYNSINPGLNTDVWTALRKGPGILARLTVNGKRKDFATEHEEDLWWAYLHNETGNLKKTDVRFEGDGEDDADYVSLPDLQRRLIQSVADTAYMKKVYDEKYGQSYPNINTYRNIVGSAKDDLRVARAIMDNPGEWILVNEGHSPYRLKVESEKKDSEGKAKEAFYFTGLGGLKNFLVRWNPKDRTLDVKDDYDFKTNGIVEGLLPVRPRPLRIRDRIKIPKEGSYISRHPEYMGEFGYQDKYNLADGGPVKVNGFSARIDTGARPVPVSGNYVEDPRRDANSEVSEMERLRDIYDYLRNNEKHKFNEIQALAITANIAAESKGRIDALGKAGDFGLQQWLGVRKNELQRRYGKNPSMEQQLDYLIDEYLGSVNGLGWNYTNRGNFYGSDRNGNKYNYYMYSKKEFDDATSYLDATVAWNQGFGRPLGSTLRNNDRRDIAKRLAEAWGVDDGEYKGYIYGMMGDDGKYEYDPERTQPPIETVVPSQGNNRVDSWWDKNGDDFMRSVLSQAGATRDMMKEMMARAEADEASKREIANQQAEAERDNLRKQVAMSLVQGMRLDIPGMARQS